MNTRKDYIMAKYVEHRFVNRDKSSGLHGLRDAIQRHDLMALLQCMANGTDLSKPLNQDLCESPLHLAVSLCERNCLPLVDFLIQNGGTLEKVTADGQTALHYGVRYNKPDCIRLLLRAKASLEKAGEGNFNAELDFDWFHQEEEISNSDEEDAEKLSPLSLSQNPVLSSSIRHYSRQSTLGLDISNKTYETFVMPARAPPTQRSQSVENPPPLPAKTHSRKGHELTSPVTGSLERPLSSSSYSPTREDWEGVSDAGLQRRASEPTRYNAENSHSHGQFRRLLKTFQACSTSILNIICFIACTDSCNVASFFFSLNSHSVLYFYSYFLSSIHIKQT
ncbi:hypothetical protein AB205_0204930, partial [Aquarana catesbeiana]